VAGERSSVAGGLIPGWLPATLLPSVRRGAGWPVVNPLKPTGLLWIVYCDRMTSTGTRAATAIRLVLRRHIDLRRTCSALCRWRRPSLSHPRLPDLE
jgi:hypothetical protein